MFNRNAVSHAMPTEMHLSRWHRVRLVAEGAVIGVIVGSLIALYRFLLSHSEALLHFCTTWLQEHGPMVVLWFLALLLICFAVDRLMMFEPYTQASGIPQIDAEVSGHIGMPWHRVVPTKLIEGVLCAFSGLSLGREGPSVLLGGMAAKGVNRLLGRGQSRAHERLMVTCGAAAGMSAAFHAPLTGVLFAVEEIHKEFSASLIISAMTSSVVADFVSSHLLGVTPLIHLVVYKTAPHGLYPAILLMGVICGMLGHLHNAGMFFVQDKLYGPFERFTPFVRMVVPFMLAGVLAFVWPDLLCGGDAIVERVMNIRNETMLTILALLIGKYVFTTICFGSGAPGGTLFPLVVMGSLVGALYGMGISDVAGIPYAYVNSFIVLGVAGLFAAVIQAPVTAVVMVFELTGSMEALLATSVVSIVAYVTASLLRTEPYYEHLYARMLGKTKDTRDSEFRHGHETLRKYIVGVGSNVDGKLVRDVTWPDGILVVTVREAGVKKVVKGSTPLNALSEITVVMDEYDELKTDELMHRLCDPRD